MGSKRPSRQSPWVLGHNARAAHRAILRVPDLLLCPVAGGRVLVLLAVHVGDAGEFHFIYDVWETSMTSCLFITLITTGRLRVNRGVATAA